MQNTDVYTVLRESLSGCRPVDESTRQSVAVMAERLDLLKKQNPVFSLVELSPDMQALAEKSGALLVS